MHKLLEEINKTQVQGSIHYENLVAKEVSF